MSTRRQFLLQTTAGIVAAASSRIANAAKAIASRDVSKAAPAAVVETALGRLDISKLGFTLSHEHVSFIPHPLFLNRTLVCWRAFPS